ncbi:MAG: PQQ-dependent sugar dehydrogenase [Gammaproteobacteria bacterium]
MRNPVPMLCFTGLLVAGVSPVAHAAGCNSDNGGISVPAGFCAEVFAKNLGPLRHLVVAADGTVYAALSSQHDGGGIVALRDTDGNGQADSINYFGDVSGTGIGLHGGYLYFAENERIVRFQLPQKGDVSKAEPQEMVTGFPEQGEHTAKSIAFDQAGNLYVNVGAPSNACQRQDRIPLSPGIDPCPLLQEHGGIWRFDADKPGQRFTADARYATGLRNVVALAWNGEANALYGVMMGRDQLHDNWPKLYTNAQSANLPAEEMIRVDAGDNFGWPYCYYDGQRNELVLAPEYGGDGTRVGRCKQYKHPLAAFPAHWAPEALVFYAGSAFPAQYRSAAFVAFHGSWNRAPLPQQGFVVAFVPFRNGKPAGKWKEFATGFAGRKAVHSPGDAHFRPVGIAEGPDGALYVADSQQGWIWRIIWRGGKRGG